MTRVSFLEIKWWTPISNHPSIFSIRPFSKPAYPLQGLRGWSSPWDRDRSHPGWFTEKQTSQIRAGGPRWPLTLWNSLWPWFVLYLLSQGKVSMWPFRRQTVKIWRVWDAGEGLNSILSELWVVIVWKIVARTHITQQVLLDRIITICCGCVWAQSDSFSVTH